MEALHICPECLSDLVYVRQWLKAPNGEVAIDRRCPDCEWTHMGICDAAELDELDTVLAGADEMMVSHLRASAALDIDAWNTQIHGVLARDNDT